MNLRKFCDWREAFKAWLVEHGYMDGFSIDPWYEVYVFGKLLKPIPNNVKLEIISKIHDSYPEIDEHELESYILNYDRKRTN